MLLINSLSLTSNVNAWLANSRQPRVLHVFESACNLINEHKDVLSVVSQRIGDGPFNLVVEDNVIFLDHLSLESPISNFPNGLKIGDLTINTQNARLWSPRQDWKILYARRENVLALLPPLPVTNYEFLVSNLQLFNSLASALVNADLPTSINATQKLAGLGIGLTPSGDDFIMGAILAAWIIHPADVAEVLAVEVTEVAAPLTTSLSGAWLRSAGRGEAGILWHQFFEALISADQTSIQESMDKILSVGETSGADALSGFVSSFAAWSVEESTKHE